MKQRSTVAAWLAGLALVALLPVSGVPDEPEGQAPKPWTLDEARAELALYPRDPYLQFVTLQLARRANQLDAVAQEVEALVWRTGFLGSGSEGRRADLFSIFTGALAVQESLQLDTMRGERGPGQRVPYVLPPVPGGRKPPGLSSRLKDVVDVAALKRPTTVSHPWEKMLAGKKPAVSALSCSVPEDYYFAEFHSVGKLLELQEIGDRWGTYLANEASRDARSQRVGARLRDQLAIETHPALRPFYDLVIAELAVTGSDLFFAEGSDVTLLFRLKQPEVFKARLDQFLDRAAQAHPDARRKDGTYLGVAYTHLATPDRAVSVYSAYPAPDLHVRSNSGVAFRRVLEAVRGKTADGRPVRRLGDTPEFAYARTLMPQGAPEEDGFVYLFDPFIRRLVGPQVKLAEQRRMRCYNHLRMIGHASLLYRTEHSRAPRSLEELARTKCSPGKFSEGALACPDGGTYTLSKDGTAGVCSHHGHAHALTPCCEIAVTKVNGVEADEYKEFLDGYNQYWRTYFDPIILRFQVTPKRYRLDTVVLPLIDNSIYTGLAQTLGGPTEPLDALPVPKRNIFSLVVRVNKEPYLKQLAEAETQYKSGLRSGLKSVQRRLDKLSVADLVAKGLGNQVGLHLYDATPMFDLNLPAFFGLLLGRTGRAGGMRGEEMLFGFLAAALTGPVYLAAPVRDGAVVDQFLDDLDLVLATQARTTDGRGAFDFGFDFYGFGTGPDRDVRAAGFRFGPIKWRFFWARIGNGLYVASKKFILDDLRAAEAERARAGRGPEDHGPTAHAMVRLRPQHWDRVLADYRLSWAEGSREACLANLGPLSNVARALAVARGRPETGGGSGGDPDGEVLRHAERLHAVHFDCPEGGRYVLAPDGRSVRCTVHGSALGPRQGPAPAQDSALDRLLREFHGMTATLSFHEDGLRASVIIDRR
jgi:hypothetical protein